MKTFSQLRKNINEKFLDIDNLRHAKVEEKPVNNYEGDYKKLKISTKGVDGIFCNLSLQNIPNKKEIETIFDELILLDKKDFQGNAVVNYTSEDVPYTRICEHKHFQFGKQEKTVITYEYPVEFTKEKIPYYPVNNKINNDIYSKYKKLSKEQEKVIFGGRLAEYKYYDMHQIIGSAWSKYKKIKKTQL